MKFLKLIIEYYKSIKRGKEILKNPRKYGIIKLDGFGKYDFDDRNKNETR